MIRKIIIIFSLLIKIIFASGVGECCTQYGKGNSGSSGVVSVIPLFTGSVDSDNGNGGTTMPDIVDGYKSSGYNSVRFCRSAGVVSINDVQSEYKGTDEWHQYEGLGTYWRSDAYVYTRDLKYKCRCDKSVSPDFEERPRTEDINISKWEFKEMLNKCATVPENQVFHTQECLESDGTNSLIQSQRADCCLVQKCWLPKVSTSVDANKTKVPADCRMGYQLIENVADEESISCDLLVDGQDLDCYELFPFGDDDYYQTLCLEDGSTATGSDGNSTGDDSSDDSNSSDDGGSSSSDDGGSSNSSDDGGSSNSGEDSNSTHDSGHEGIEERLDTLIRDNKLDSNRNHDDLGSLELKLDKLNKDNNTNSDNERIANKEASDKAHEDAKSIKDAIIEGNQINSHFYRDIKAVIGNNTNESGSGTSTDTNSSDSSSSDSNSSDSNTSDSAFLDSLGKKMEGATNALENSLNTFKQNKQDLANLIGGNPPSMAIPTGDCSLSTPLFGKTFSLDLATFATFRPFLQFILNLTLLIITIRLYITIARDITLYFS